MSDVDEDNFDRTFDLLRPGTRHPDHDQQFVKFVVFLINRSSEGVSLNQQIGVPFVLHILCYLVDRRLEGYHND